MANELIPTRRKVVYGLAETTAGTDIAPTATNVMYFDEFNVNVVEEMIERNGVSPEGPGFRPAVGASMVEIDFETEIVFPTISAADTTDLPSVHPLLHAGLWKRQGDSTDNTQIYILASYGKQSSTFYVYEIDEDDADANLTKCVGTVFSTTLSWTAGERLSISGSGLSKGFFSTGDTDDIYDATGAGSSSVTYPSDDPTVAKDATVKVMTTGAVPTVYGGGTAASPNNDLVVTSLELESGVEVHAQRGFSALGGIKRIRGVREGYATLTLTMEMASASDFNPVSYRHDRTVLEVNLTFTNPATTTNKCQFLFYGCVTEVSKEDDAGRRLWTLTLQGVYPEDASDSDPLAGRSPTQLFKAGTNKGLYLDPTSGPARGIAALTFYST